MKRTRGFVAGLAAAGLLAAAGCSATGHAATPQSDRLVGSFRLTPGHCTSVAAKPTGSYLVAVSAAANKAVRNPKSTCVNRDYTLLRPGTAGGLVTGQFQPQPDPLFDAHRNSRASAIVEPTWFGPFRLGFATEAQDEQDAPTGAPAFPTPQATVINGTLNVDLRSLVVSYAGPANGTCATSFGLGCWQLGSKSATGTYDARTRQFVLDWFSGESFTPKGDSIEVHLTGNFVPAADSGLAASQGLVTSLPAALREVPIAARDLSNGHVSPARAAALFSRSPALTALANAVRSPFSAVRVLIASYDAGVAGRPIGSLTEIESAVSQLQEIEGDIVPAVRLVATQAGRGISAAAALTAIEHDSRVPELADLVGSWQQLYGGLLALEQKAAAPQ